MPQLTQYTIAPPPSKSAYESKVGTASLNTTAQNLSGAVNELNTKLISSVGSTASDIGTMNTNLIDHIYGSLLRLGQIRVLTIAITTKTYTTSFNTTVPFLTLKAGDRPSSGLYVPAVLRGVNDAYEGSYVFFLGTDGTLKQQIANNFTTKTGGYITLTIAYIASS